MCTLYAVELHITELNRKPVSTAVIRNTVGIHIMYVV